MTKIDCARKSLIIWIDTPFPLKKYTFRLRQKCVFLEWEGSSYSPQLNLIEILWRFMKYEWIELNAYESWDSLVSYSLPSIELHTKARITHEQRGTNKSNKL